MNIDKNKIRKKIFEKFHVVIYSSDSNKDTKNLHFSRFFLISVGLLAVSIYTFFLLSVLLWTPMSSILTGSASETKRINMLEQKVKKITSELTLMQNYNIRLRYALGDTSANNSPNPVKTDDIIAYKPSFTGFVNDNRESGSFLASNVSNDIIMVQPFSLPVGNYIISQKYDEENNHNGIDFAGKTGEPIMASAEGYVIFSNWTLDYGNTIIIMHSTKYITKYKHNSVNLKPVGSFVRRGEIIALLGNSGKLSTSPHLHFEIWKNGISIDPLKFLMIKN